MSKNVTSAVLYNQRKSVATQATLLTIVRTDGITYRLTSHDQDITFQGQQYTHKHPFVLSAISTGSQLAVDSVDLTLALDDTVFKLSEFKRQAFSHAKVTITEVDFMSPDDGGMTLREGWFGPLSLAQYGVARVTVVGLLKVVDIEVGRVYQPSCDADLGDGRCKVAINLNQQRDYRETMRTGDWRYVFNPTGANEIPLINSSFEDDGIITNNVAPITGWSKTPTNAPFLVNDGGALPNPTDGGLMLMGDGDPSDNGRGEVYLHQDVDLIASGISATDIDAGRISMALFADMMQTNYLLDPISLAITLYGGDHETVVHHDTGFFRLDEHNVWRTKNHVFPVFSSVRYAKITLGFRREDGFIYNGAVDNVRLYWWDHVSGTPWDDVIHKVQRVVNLKEARVAKYPVNSGFENTQSPYTDTQNILGWTKSAGSFWGVASNMKGSPPAAPEGLNMLVSGDNLSGVQSTYQISQTIHLVDMWKLVASSIAAGRYVGSFNYTIVWGDAESAAQITLEWLNAVGDTVSTDVVFNYASRPAPTYESRSNTFVIPAAARQVRVVLRAMSPSSSSNAKIGFDEIFFGIADAYVIDKNDPVAAAGSSQTVFTNAAGGYTFDGSLLWRAFSHHVQYDQVSTVTDRKKFTGTDIAGAEGAYETGVILWISGENRGQRNLIRVWEPSTKGIKLYFESVNPIQPGDRFQYIRSCQKRFKEDCQLRYDNVINFRGFPYLPGRVSD